MPFTQEEQQCAFGEELEALCERYATEWDLTFASMIGVMELQKLAFFERELALRIAIERETEE